jgi:SPP1 family predicted phage head-tail adaptor
MTPLRSGDLNRRVNLEQRSSTRDSFGEELLTWSDLMTVWAEIQPLSGRELELAQKMASEVSHRITIRYQSSLTDTRMVAGLRALYKARVFNIVAVLNEDEANVRLQLLASEGLNDGA